MATGRLGLLLVAALAAARLPLGRSGRTSVYASGAPLADGPATTVAVEGGALVPIGVLDEDPSAPVPGVAASATFGGVLLVGGSFALTGNRTADPHLYQWDCVAWTPFLDDAGVGMPPTLLCEFAPGRLAVAMASSAGGAIAIWDDSALATVADVGPASMTGYRNLLVVGGSFTAINGQPCAFLCAWNGTTWTPVAQLDAPATVVSVYSAYGLLVVFGSFQTVGGEAGVRPPAYYDGSTWFSPFWPFGSGVTCMAEHHGLLYIAGGFEERVAAFDGVTQTYVPVIGAPASVIRLLAVGGMLYAALQHPLSEAAPVYGSAMDSNGDWNPIAGLTTAVRALAAYCPTNYLGSNCTECQPGFYGPDCTACDLCVPHGQCFESALGNCTCVPAWTGSTCAACADGFFGPNCTACAECERHGVCEGGVGGRCNCSARWTGDVCGECLPGYFGVGGDACVPCEVCVPHGVCHEGLRGNCTCTDEGWTGATCSDCGPGRYGDACALCAECNGRCAEGVAGNCTCDPGFAGAPACDQCVGGAYGPGCNLSCATCEMHGVCYEGLDGNCTCTATYWIGEECAVCVPQNNVSIAPPCPCSNLTSDCHRTQGRGRCIHGTCVCNFGYSGDFCDIASGCREPEQSCVHGTCSSHDGVTAVCACYSGYTGARCDELIRAPVNLYLVIIPPLLVMVLAWALRMYAVWHARRNRYEPFDTTVIYLAVFTLFEFTTDVVFIVAAYTDGSLGIPPAVAVVSTMFMAFLVCTDGIMSATFLVSRLTKVHESDEAYFSYPRNVPFLVIIWVLSLMNVELLRLTFSGILDLSAFKVPFEEGPKALSATLERMAWATIVLGSVPQLVLQLYLLTQVFPSTISIVTATAAMIVLAYTLLVRVWTGLIQGLFAARRAAAVNGTSLGFLEVLYRVLGIRGDEASDESKRGLLESTATSYDSLPPATMADSGDAGYVARVIIRAVAVLARIVKK